MLYNLGSICVYKDNIQIFNTTGNDCQYLSDMYPHLKKTYLYHRLSTEKIVAAISFVEASYFLSRIPTGI